MLIYSHGVKDDPKKRKEVIKMTFNELKIIDEMDVGNICLKGLSKLAEYEINSSDSGKLSVIEDEDNSIYYLYENDGCVNAYYDTEKFKNIEELNQRFEKSARGIYADYLHEIEMCDGDIDEALTEEQKEHFLELQKLIKARDNNVEE